MCDWRTTLYNYRWSCKLDDPLELPSAATETQLEFIDVSLISANHRSDLQTVQQPICISSVVSQSTETGTVSGDEAQNHPKSGLADDGTEVTMPPSHQQLQPMSTSVAPSCNALPTFPPDNAAGMMMMMTMLAAFTQQQQQQQQPDMACANSVEGLWWTFNEKKSAERLQKLAWDIAFLARTPPFLIPNISFPNWPLSLCTKTWWLIAGGTSLQIAELFQNCWIVQL